MNESPWKACWSAAGKLAGPMQGYRPGDIAALRKLAIDPDTPPLAAPFWRLVGALESPLYDPAKPDGQTERRLALVLGGMALLAFGMNQRGFHDYDMPLGKALAKTRYSEKRLLALLSARDETFEDLFTRMVRFLAQKHQGLNWAEILRLLLLTDDTSHGNIRRKIARDYHFETAPRPKPQES